MRCRGWALWIQKIIAGTVQNRNSSAPVGQLRKPIFRPGIRSIAVTAHFPEAKPIFCGKLNRAHELRTFPRV